MIIIELDYNNDKIRIREQGIPSHIQFDDVKRIRQVQGILYEFINMLNSDCNNIQMIKIDEDTRSIIEEW